MSKDTDREQALAFYDDGVPSTLPAGNRFKAAVESHRWGRHGDRPRQGCPVCSRRLSREVTA